MWINLPDTLALEIAKQLKETGSECGKEFVAELVRHRLGEVHADASREEAAALIEGDEDLEVDPDAPVRVRWDGCSWVSVWHRVTDPEPTDDAVEDKQGDQVEDLIDTAG